jgi:hypothetical protein
MGSLVDPSPHNLISVFIDDQNRKPGPAGVLREFTRDNRGPRACCFDTRAVLSHLVVIALVVPNDMKEAPHQPDSPLR